MQIDKLETNIRNQSNKDTSPTIRKTQLPLMFAWSSTVNKVSDLILKEMVLSFDLFKEKDFSYIHM